MMKSESILALLKYPVEKPPRNVQAAASLVWLAAAVLGYWCMRLLLCMLPSHIFGRSVAFLHHPSLRYLQGYDLIMTYIIVSTLAASGAVLGYIVWHRNRLTLWLLTETYLYITGSLLLSLAFGTDLSTGLIVIYGSVTLFLLSLASPQQDKK
jgi:hypothetical protein